LTDPGPLATERGNEPTLAIEDLYPAHFRFQLRTLGLADQWPSRRVI
jgi:hypothetical protein